MSEETTQYVAICTSVCSATLATCALKHFLLTYLLNTLFCCRVEIKRVAYPELLNYYPNKLFLSFHDCLRDGLVGRQFYFVVSNVILLFLVTIAYSSAF